MCVGTQVERNGLYVKKAHPNFYYYSIYSRLRSIKGQSNTYILESRQEKIRGVPINNPKEKESKELLRRK